MIELRDIYAGEFEGLYNGCALKEFQKLLNEAEDDGFQPLWSSFEQKDVNEYQTYYVLAIKEPITSSTNPLEMQYINAVINEIQGKK
jgi:hypothetical protein